MHLTIVCGLWWHFKGREHLKGKLVYRPRKGNCNFKFEVFDQTVIQRVRIQSSLLTAAIFIRSQQPDVTLSRNANAYPAEEKYVREFAKSI